MGIIQKKSKALVTVLVLCLVIIIAVGAIIVRNKSKKIQVENKANISEEIETDGEFDLTTDEGRAGYIDHVMKDVMTSELYGQSDWLARKHYVYMELLKFEEDELIKNLYYEKATRSFSIEYMDGSIRWYHISED